jgi:hypothetical protein
MDEYQSSVAQAGVDSADTLPKQLTAVASPTKDPLDEGHPALVRRIPGTHLAPGLRDRRAAVPAQRTGGSPRNPDEERATFDSFTTGWALAGKHRPVPAQPTVNTDHHPTTESAK